MTEDSEFNVGMLNSRY